MCFTVQSEVGDRFTAEPGCKAFGPLTILSGVLAKVTIVTRLGPQSFWPRPAVDSVMLRMDVDPAAREAIPDVPAFARFVRGVFDHRRKTLRSAMSYVLDAPTIERLGEKSAENLRAAIAADPQSIYLAQLLAATQKKQLSVMRDLLMQRDTVSTYESDQRST